MNAVDEMRALNRDIKEIFDQAGAEYSIWKSLEEAAGAYIKKEQK